MNRSLAELADWRASGALRIKFSDGRVRKKEEFGTAVQNEVLQVRLTRLAPWLAWKYSRKAVPGGEHKTKNNVCFLFAQVVVCSALFSTGAPCVAIRTVFLAAWNVRDSKRSSSRRAAGGGIFPG